MALRWLLIILSVIFFSLYGLLLLSQESNISKEKATQQSSSEQQVTEEEMPDIDQGYSYDPGDRRDPFVPLKMGRKGSPQDRSGRTGECPRGCLISEMELKGIVKDASGVFIAIFVGPDKKTHKMKVGDKFYDGEIMSIDIKKVVIKQEVQDPTEIIKFREVIVYLHPAEGKTP